jgi:hypothetical protein
LSLVVAQVTTIMAAAEAQEDLDILLTLSQSLVFQQNL